MFMIKLFIKLSLAFFHYAPYRKQPFNRLENMQLIAVIFLALAFTCSIGDKLDDANNYLKEVLSDHLPSAIEAAGLKVYKLPDFVNEIHERTSDGDVIDTKFFYRAGNLTGLQNVLKDRCFEPSESSGTISVVCQIILPDLQAEYAGRFQSIKGSQNPFSVHIRQFDFDLYIYIKDVELEIEVTSSTGTQIASLKRLTVKWPGKRSIAFNTEASNPEDVTQDVEEKFNEPFFKLFSDGEFKKALETAVGNTRYPKSE